jgi:hypothetical protein
MPVSGAPGEFEFDAIDRQLRRVDDLAHHCAVSGVVIASMN